MQAAPLGRQGCPPREVACAAKKGGSRKADSPRSEDSWQASSGGPLPPPRITDTSQFSLKKQLRLVRGLKEAEARRAPAPAVRSKFRRKREAPKPEERAAEAEPGADALRDEALLRKGRGLKSLYNTQDLDNPPAVLVDGYNVLLRWLAEPGEDLRKARVGGDLLSGRTELLRDLSEYSAWCKLRLMVAFDAQGNLEAPLIARDTTGGVEVVFVRGEADSFIIGEAQELRKAGCPFVLVASSDNDVRDACMSNEVFPVHASQLLRDIRKAKEEASNFYRRTRARGASDRLGSVLSRANPALHRQLEQARVQGVKHLG